MKIKSLLNERIEHHDLCPGAITLEQWASKTWLDMRIGNRIVPIFPLWPIRDVLSKHDIHHILTGYSTDMRGESELAAWELGSGGCHHNVVFWVDRISFLFIGLLAFPIPTLQALYCGMGCRNLFSRDIQELLEMDVASVKYQLGL